MTRPDIPSTPEPLNPQEEEVRRLLADARHTGPTPPDVVARLDRVLADLADEPVREGAVVRLATRRRRTTSLLVAAAAVVVIGIGVGQVFKSGDSDESGNSATSGGVQSDADAGAAQEENSDGLAEDEEGTQGEEAPTSPAELAAGDLATLNPQNFGNDVRTTRSQLSALVANGDAFLDRKSSAMRADEAAGAACRSRAWGRGSFVPVRYGETPAVLVFRRTRGNTQIADLFLCGSEQPVRSVTLPAP